MGRRDSKMNHTAYVIGTHEELTQINNEIVSLLQEKVQGTSSTYSNIQGEGDRCYMLVEPDYLNKYIPEYLDTLELKTREDMVNMGYIIE